MPTFKVQPVDTTGAGDGFMAGLLAGLLADPDASPTPRRLDRICRFANAVGALTTTRARRDPALPTRAAVDELIGWEFRPMTAEMLMAPVTVLDLRSLVFGGTGDLALRKLLPALYQRDRASSCRKSRIIGVARSQLSTGRLCGAGRGGLRQHLRRRVRRRGLRAASAARINYVAVDATSARAGTSSPDAGRRATTRPRLLSRHLARPVRPDLPSGSAPPGW